MRFQIAVLVSKKNTRDLSNHCTTSIAGLTHIQLMQQFRVHQTSRGLLRKW